MVQTREQTEQPAEKLQIWDMLELRLKQEECESRYQARVEEITDDHILIDRPTFLSGAELLSEKAELTVVFVRPESLYRFDSRLLAVDVGERGFCRIAVPKRIERKQRRRFYRIDLKSPVNYIHEDDLLPGCRTDESQQHHSRTLNLSANGFLMTAERALPLGERLCVSITSDELDLAFSTLGEVTRVREDKGKYDCAVRFFSREEIDERLNEEQIRQLPQQYLDFGERERSKLVNAIFARQLKLRRRGML